MKLIVLHKNHHLELMNSLAVINLIIARLLASLALVLSFAQQIMQYYYDATIIKF